MNVLVVSVSSFVCLVFVQCVALAWGSSGAVGRGCVYSCVVARVSGGVKHVSLAHGR